MLFIGFLVENDLQSMTVKTYISAIKGVLPEINVKISENHFLLQLLTKACQLKNDRVVNPFPIYKETPSTDVNNNTQDTRR